jgi:hypothetical protein
MDSRDGAGAATAAIVGLMDALDDIESYSLVRVC